MAARGFNEFLGDLENILDGYCVSDSNLFELASATVR